MNLLQQMLIPLVAGFVVSLLISALNDRHGVAVRQRIAQWAQAQGFEILYCERRSYFFGPFPWTSAFGRVVHYVVIRDREAMDRLVWVRCGGIFRGMRSDALETVWDKPPGPQLL